MKRGEVHNTTRTTTPRPFLFSILLLAIITTLLTTLSGCIMGPKEDKNVLMTPEGRPATKDGIKISFEKGYPPVVARPSDEIETMVHLKNKGSYSIKKGGLTLTLAAPDFDIDGPLEWTNDELLDGLADGGFGEDLSIDKLGKLTFGGLPFAGKEMPAEITAKVCYYYETTAAGQLCLKPAPDDDATICSEKGNKIQTHSSAPIYITSVLEKIYPHSTELKITVRNEGDGTSHHRSTNCDEKERENYVSLVKLTVGGVDYTQTCGPSTERSKRLSDGEVTYNCELVVPTASVMTEPFEVVFSYKYATDIKQVVKVS